MHFRKSSSVLPLESQLQVLLYKKIVNTCIIIDIYVKKISEKIRTLLFVTVSKISTTIILENER